ncbi:hypothetical protein [Parafrankia discariae]|uniref:hypothetical protein n=1 Tax=Parafrankia discariae TaxID=365528 RepID=UPI000362768B|nr:hypothetical protein [Parafrankia discariae]
MNGGDGVWEAARAIRPYLADLLGPLAAELDQRLAEELTADTERSEREPRLRDLLERYPGTRWFLAEVLADAPHHRPPYEQPRHERHYADAGPAGDPSPVTADRYVCPHSSHDYAWYRRDVAEPVPQCATHHVTLIRG